MRLNELFRPIVLMGAIYFGVFAVVAFVFRRLDVSDDTLSIVGGILAYGFLVSVIFVVVRQWRATRKADRS